MEQLKKSSALALLYLLLVARCSAISSDQRILLDFKESQRNGNCSAGYEYIFSSWTSGSGEWAGVTFAKDGVVSALNLTEWGLCGLLPQSFASLQWLTYLDLRHNVWEGPLPEAWSRLLQMTELILASQPVLDEFGDYVIGNITGTLPQSYSTLVNLRVLDISGNGLSGTLPAQYSTMQSLQALALSGSYLNGTLPAHYSTLQALQYLTFGGNALTGTLPAQYSALVYLTYLSFSSNGLTGTLPAQYSALSYLSSLDFDFNSLTGTSPVQYIALSSLTYLSFAYNNLTGTLPAQYSALSSLIFLSVDSNTLTGTLPAQYSALSSLTLMRVDSNVLTGTLPAQYSALTSLQYLNFEDNNLDGTLPVQYAALASLWSLSFASNDLDGTLPAQYSALELLNTLSFEGNNLTGMLPAQYSALKGLTALSCANNVLTGTLPAEYSALTLLTSLSLARNPFPPQQVPLQWMQDTSFWSNLAYLDMSSMQLTGQLPAIPDSAAVFNMSNGTLTGSIASIPESLKYINLAGNKLSGSIPPVNSAFLVYLDISNNQLSQLPNVFEAPIATFFSVANNSLAGSIPDYSNHSLLYCDLRNNSLTGSIPSSWTKRNFSFLALGYNKLSERLPTVWEGNVSVLLMQNNSISGCLPDAWTHNDSMSILSLSNNTLTCKLPKNYATFFKNLSGIYLDGNQFGGLIPVQWMNGFSSADRDKTVLYLGSMWLESSDRSQQRSILSNNQYWRKDICLSGDLNARLKGLSKASIPDSMLRELQSQLNAAMALAQAKSLGDTIPKFLFGLTIQLPPVTTQLSNHTQPSSRQICMNSRARYIVAIQWAIVVFLLLLVVFLYVSETRFRLLSRLRPKLVVFLQLSERSPVLVPICLSLLRLAGIAFYWFDVGTDVYLLRQVFRGDSLWAPWVLLAILLLHYVIGAGVLGWYFAAKRRYILLVCVLVFPVMPLVDTVAALMTAARDAGNRWSLAAVDWEAVFELRHALEFLLESIPMAIMQTAIYVAGNSPKSGVYLDDWTYVLSASGTCFQILGMVTLVLSRAAKQGKSPWQVLLNLLTLPKKPLSSLEDNDVMIGLREL